MGRLKRGSGERLIQDHIQIIILLSLFNNAYYSVLQQQYLNELHRQLSELRTFARVVMCRNKYIITSIEEYYVSVSLNNIGDGCDGLCPTFRGECYNKANMFCLVDHIEASIFDNGSFTPATLSIRIFKRNIIMGLYIYRY